MRFLKFKIFLFLSLIANFVFSQQDNTLFFMHDVPQSNFVNPAVQIKCIQYYGLPLLSSLHLNLNTTGFSYKSLSPGESALDVDLLTSKMHLRDFLTFEFHYTPLSFGFMYDKNQYFNFAWTEKIDFKLSYSRALIELLKDGNSQYVNDGFRTRNPGINAFYYRELSFGYSKKVNRDFFLGAHAKVLFGLAGVFTKRRPMSMSVNGFTYNIDATWNPKVNTSLPLNMSYDALGNVNSVSLGSISPVSFLLNFKNQGLATDFGFIYKKDKITWSGSVLDLGLIWWHDQPYNFENKGNFVFQGATVTDGMDPAAYATSIRDSLSNQFRFKATKKGFITFLNPRIYFGGTYPVHKQVKVGALVRTELYPGRPILGTTISATGFTKKGSNLSVSYSVLNGSFLNLGLGAGFTNDKFQFFILSDNLIAFFKPETTRNVNLRFGFNFFIGCEDKKPKKDYKISKGSDCGCNWAPTPPKSTEKLKGKKN